MADASAPSGQAAGRPGLTGLRQKAPDPLKRIGRAAYLWSARPTAAARLTPDFIVAGVQRGGTTSLFRALLQHPQAVRPTFHKGTDYFSQNYRRGEGWYRSHFPLRFIAARRRSQPPITFESCEYYLFHPLAAGRIAADLPRAKIVVMLRDPVERAYSAYEHERARGYDDRSFEQALAEEDELVEADLAKMATGEIDDSYACRHYAYRHRGDYVTQLERLFASVPRDQVLVLQSEEFFANPESVFERLTRFVGLQPVMPSSFDQHNARPRAEMSQAARARLVRFAKDQGPRLESLIGQELRWESLRSTDT